MENIEKALAAHPFLKGMAPGLVKELVDCASEVTFNAGDFVCRVDDEANQFYLIQSGRIAVQHFSSWKGPITVATLGEGDDLGRFWVEKTYRWRFEARAQQLTRAIALDVKKLSQKCEGNHDLGYDFLKRYTYSLVLQFRATRLQLLDMLKP
jgi:CRP/FNR family cyclic AMP-dependent transcriptional regulator